MIGAINMSAHALIPDEDAFNNAVDILENTSATDDERSKAVTRIMSLAAKGYGKALNEIGAFYGTGRLSEFPKNCDKAIEYFEKAWNAKEIQAAQNLAIIYRNGDCFAPDFTKAYEWTKKGADAGHVGSMFDLGLYYLEPNYGAEIDSISAIGWFRRAAELGHGDAMWQLSRYYHQKGNDEEARYWLKQGVDKESANCVHGMGLSYKDGINGMPQDDAVALTYFIKGADEYGMDESAYEAGELLLKIGQKERARKYFNIAAEHNHVPSVLSLGESYIGIDDRRVVETYDKLVNKIPVKDVPEEHRWILGWSFYKLALCYYLGKGVAQDKKKGAEMLYYLAEEKGLPMAIDAIRKLNIPRP